MGMASDGRRNNVNKMGPAQSHDNDAADKKKKKNYKVFSIRVRALFTPPSRYQTKNILMK